METFLRGVEQLAPAEALSNSFVAYPLVNALHIAAVGALLASILFMHASAFGLVAAFRGPEAERTFRRVAVGVFAVAALSGLALFSVNAIEYAANPAFRIKLLLLLLAGFNLALYMVVDRWRVAGSIASMLLWPAVLVAGRFIGFV